MSKYDDIIKEQPEITREAYYCWIKSIKEKSKSRSPQLTRGRESLVTSFLSYTGYVSIHDISEKAIKAFLESKKPEVKAGRIEGSIEYLIGFLNFVQDQYHPKWDFEVNKIRKFAPPKNEVSIAGRGLPPMIGLCLPPQDRVMFTTQPGP